jgi:membrane-associated protein
MEFLKSTLDWFLHLDKILPELIKEYGTWTYAILFLIIFAETGLVVIPFLPGDSLLFAAGMIASLGQLNVWLLIVLLIVAAFIGDTVNYHVGKFLGPKLFSGKPVWGINLSKILKKEYLDQAQAFYEKHGGKAIILARFVPIVRTFAPFVAGMGSMKYIDFMLYNLVGGIIWVTSFTLLGYRLAENVWVREHVTVLALSIVAFSLIPIAIQYFINKNKKAE